MTANKDQFGVGEPGTVLHWYDFICPFCYVGQQRNAVFARQGLEVVELPFQAHPDIPRGGIQAGPRNGTMYAMLEREAREAGLPLHWPQHLPNSRMALAAAEWTRQHQAGGFSQFHRQLFEAHFALGEDLADPTVIDTHASASGIDLAKLHAALADGSAMEALAAAEVIARQYGVQGTPAWLFPQGMIMGLRPASDFERLANEATRLAQ
jgi:predicted DsbA family dithiol-disulfide isomerase